MSPKQFYFVMVGVLILMGVLAGSGAVMANKLLTKKTARLSELKLENEVYERQKEDVIRAQKDLDKYADLEKIAKQIVPQEKDQARTTREILNLAQQAGIDIASVTFPSSTLGQKAAPVAKPAEGEAAPTTPAAPPITQVKPVDGITGVYQLEITVQNGDPATYPKLINFLKRLEINRRTAQVVDLTITPNAANRNVLTFSMKINLYIKP